MTDQDLQFQLQPLLLNGEKVLWTGKPKSGILLKSTDWFLIPFSFLWFGFAIFWESSVIISGAPFFFKLWGIPFLIVGFYITIGRFIFEAIKRKNTMYGITDNRIIIYSGLWNKSTKSYNIKSVSDLSFSEKSNGSGTINIGPDDTGYNIRYGLNIFPGSNSSPKLEGIENVRNLYEMILKLQ